MSALFLIGLALLDGALLGFRAAAGRMGRVEKHGYHVRAMALGVVAAAIVSMGGVGLAFALVVVRGASLWPALVQAGAAAASVFATFATLVVSALAVWLIPQRDLRTFVTVSVLGPGTLVRPYVIVLGMLAGFATEPRFEVALLGAHGAFAMLSLEGLMARRCFPIDPTLFS